jgi:hypothetical protein
VQNDKLQKDLDAQIKEVNALCVAIGSKDADREALKENLASLLQDKNLETLISQVNEMKKMISNLRCCPQDEEREWWARIVSKQAEDDKSAILPIKKTLSCGVG